MPAALFADDRIVRARRTQTSDDHRLGFAIELGHHVGVGEFRAHHLHALGSAMSCVRTRRLGELFGEFAE